jgi:secreted trypsin-like serine protease
LALVFVSESQVSGSALRGQGSNSESIKSEPAFQNYYGEDEEAAIRWLREVEKDELDSKIVGGREANEDAYPYLAALYATTVDPSHPLCGGMLISPNLVLTAAHCTYYTDAVLLGAHDLSIADDVFALGQLPGHELHRIESMSQKIVHPEYSELNLRADMALLVLNKPSTKTPVRINTSDDLPVVGEKVTAMGWGVDYDGWLVKTVSEVPREVNLSTMSALQCRAKYFGTNYYSFVKEDVMLCAKDLDDGDGDACQGDSGGPLISKGDNPSDTSSHVLYGVTSWGYGCADGYPGVYSRISYAKDWIESKVALQQ